MAEFAITFDRPWLMLLLIPALALTLITYFLLSKRFRKTRNRIVSMVLHMIVMLLCISVLSGLKFEYVIPNNENEILLLVDVSDTSEQSRNARDDFMETVINESQYDNYKVGVVTFGFTQVYAVPLTFDIDSILGAYRSAPLPDTSATDIASALRYAATLFEHPKSGKIVLISDGKETDESASTVIRTVSAQGTKVDTVCIGSEFATDNVQVLGVQYPDYHVNINDPCPIDIQVHSKNGAAATVVELLDNGQFDDETGRQIVDIAPGTQSVSFRMKFTEEGLHEIRVKITESDDRLETNNTYYSYFYLELYNRILVIDRGTEEGESDAITDLLESGDGVEEIKYQVTQLHLNSSGDVPTSVDELLDYDQIILNNIASKDLAPYGLEPLLYSYVNEYGGGMFTVGGNGEDGEANAYDRFDLRNTLLQQMLPVQAIDYTPPVGVVIVIDVSGSMADGDKLQWAKNGAVTCLDALSERDYVGIVTLESSYHTELQLTSRTEETTIKEVIEQVELGGSTQYTPAITRSGRALIAEQRVDRRHIIIISDGMPTDTDTNYLPEIDRLNRGNGITVSTIGVDISEGSQEAAKMQEIADHGQGRFYISATENELMTMIKEDLQAPEIKEMEAERFYPAVAQSKELSPVLSGVEYSDIQDTDADGRPRFTADALPAALGGFYGVKARERADVILVGEYEVPIYAQWKFGAGMVGSFMCDLNGSDWSQELFADANGQKLLRNIVSTLMPISNIRPNSIRLSLSEENYINHLSVYTTLNEGERIEGTITEYTADGGEIVRSLNELSETTDGDFYITTNLNADNRFTRSSFVLKKSGIYKITVTKYDADGAVIGLAETYKSFSYSKEYDMLTEESPDPAALMADLASKGNGTAVASDDPWSVFDDFVTGDDRVFDPALAFMIAAAVCFLADIAVRKFKFKWLHEIIRNHREKKAAQQE